MKKNALGVALAIGLSTSLAPTLWANVTITSATGGNNISSDKALNSTNGAAFTAIGNIVITEGATTDFAAGTNQTFILSVPPGWQLNPGVGTVSFTATRDITAASISVTPSNAIVTLTVSGTNKLDVLTIGGLQAQILDGANISDADYIRCLFTNPGTETIAGVDLDFTTFGLLNEVAGTGRALAMHTQPGTNSTAGAFFSPQPAVQVVDQFGNLLNLNNTTVVTAALASGSGTLQGSNKCTVVFGVATYTNLYMNTAGTITLQFTATNLTSVISDPIVIGPAPADHLVFSTQPGSASAGVPFSIQPVIKTKDRFGSDSAAGLPASLPVTVTLSSGSGTLTGTTSLDIGSAAGNGVISFTDLQINAAGTNKQLTASAAGLTNAVSAAFGVSAALYTKLQVILPGESAAPGTLNGKTGIANPQAVGAAFNVTVNAVDDNWNLVNTIVDTVQLTTTDTNAILPPNAALVSGTKVLSVTLNTYGTSTLTATDVTDSSKAANTSSAINVGAGSPVKLAFQTAPSATATAGAAFAQQPVIAVTDAGGDLALTDNGRVITVARVLGSGTLQGTLTAKTTNGLATFTNLSYNFAETITLNFTATGLTNVTSGNIVVSPGPFAKLQLLVPGESAAPGTSTGKIGTPTAQSVATSFAVSVNAVDAWWNLISNVTDTVAFSSSDAAANLPAPASTVGGKLSASPTFNTSGTATITASDLSDGSKSASTSPSITVNPAQFTQATGGGAIPADGAVSNTFTTLTGPSYSEVTNRNVGKGTLILNAPTGFIFDTGGTAPTVLVTRLSGSGANANNINGVASGTAVAMTSVTTTQLVFTATSSSTNAVVCSLTWTNVRVRPTAGTPLASGILSMSGTSVTVGLSTNSNLGTLREVAGAARLLVIQTQPSAVAIAGVPFAQQPVLQIFDQFGTLRSVANGVTNGTVVTAARGDGSGTLQGTLNVTSANGVAAFTNLFHNVATNITLAFSAPGAITTNSSTISISPAAADRLAFVTQPGSTTYGSALAPQPVLKSRDPFGNDSTIGLAASQIVTISLSAGSGAIQGTTSLDIGTSAGNGIVAYTDLAPTLAGAGKQLSAAASGLSSAVSSNFVVNPAIVTASITASSKVYDGTTNAAIATRSLFGVVGSDDVSLSGGTASFATKTVGTAKTVTATGLGLSGTTAPNYQLATTTATTTADITVRSLNVSATGVNKAYDGTVAATVTLSDNRVVGDSLTNAYSSASFADKTVGTAKPVSVSGISMSGTDAANYQLTSTSASTTASITARSLTISATGVNKVYDGTTNATVTLSDNRIAGDSLSASYSSAGFVTKTVSTNKTLNVSGISVSGTDSTNYTFNATATTTANITAYTLTVTATGLNKIYDGTTNATVTLSDNRIAGDIFSTTNSSASFADKNVGAAKTVLVRGISLSGTDASNYSANTNASTTADITVRSLTVTATGINKVYDGSTNATVTLLDNRVPGDNLTNSWSSASFADKYVGTSKPVSVSGITVGGTDAPNYSANTTASTIANITASALTVTGITAADKVYDATTTATLTTVGATLVGLIGGDSVTMNSAGAIGVFADKNVGTNKTVSVSGLSLSGADSINYSLTQPTPSASITKAGLTITADNKSRAAGQANPTLTTSYSGFVGGETLATSGVTGSPALSTTSTNVVGTYPITAAAGTLSAANYSFGFVNGVLTVTPGSASQLAMYTQPSASAIAGVAFAQQPAVAARDAYGNLVNTNGLVITAARSAGSGTLQGTLTASTVAGLATFANLSHNVANTINLNFSGTGLTNTTSANIAVSPAAFTQLQLLAPGESTAPGTASGKTGTPTAQLVGMTFPVTVNAVDAFWNRVTNVADTIILSSSDIAANLPPSSALVAGTQTPNVTLNTTGSSTVTASDLTDGSKSASTSAAISATPSQFTSATGGTSISADSTATSTFTSLTGPSYSEIASGNVGAGTLILKAPAGFVFDTGGTAPTVLITRLTGTAKNTANINGVASGTAVGMSSISTTQLVFTVTNASSSGVTCSLGWQNVRVRPTAGAPLALGVLRIAGTSVTAGITTNSSLGTLREVAGAAHLLAIQTQPSGSATAGVAFAQQPVLKVLDQFGTLRSSANGVSDSTAVAAARNAGSGTLQGTLSATATNGLATFNNLFHTVATNITLAFSGTGLVGTNSTTISISPAAADHLAFSTQPGPGTYGSILSPQPVLKTRDPFGNDSSVGLAASQIVSLTLTAGSGALQGTTTLDIGAAAGNGILACSDLAVSAAGSGKQINAGTASGLASTVSSNFVVNPATVSGSITAASKVYDGTTNATIALRSLTGAMNGDDVSLSGGTATFASKTVGTAKTVTATGLSLSGTSAANYQLASTSATTVANITARPLSVSATGVNKAYDGTTSATVTLSDNRVAGDSLTSAYTNATFADKNIGSAKPVAVSGISISGTDAPNYSVNTSANTTANITSRSLTISATGVNKVYDSTTNATVTLTDNRVAGDNLTTAYASAGFATKSVGTAKPVSVTGLSISGPDSTNYTFNSTATATANITPLALLVSATGVNKTYDGTTNATVTLSDNRLSGDSLSNSYAKASFANKNVGAAKTITVSGISIGGTDAANYSANTNASASADITVRSLIISATGVNKVYDGSTNATVTLSDNRVAGDSLSTAYGAASFADKYVGTAKPVAVSAITVSGTDAPNYSANTTASATANITTASLTALVSANNRIYDGTTNATLASSSLSGAAPGDDVSLNVGPASFASKTVGNNKSVTVKGLSLSGADAANYQLPSSTTTTANITVCPLTVSATGVNKVYDGTTNATVTLSDNRIAGDSLTVSYASAGFASKSVGAAKAISVTGISLSGLDATNYSANPTASATADITVRTLTITAAGVNKAYDGTTNATVTLSDNRVAGDSVTTSYSNAGFADKYIGSSKPVSVSGITVSGTDASNYSANTTASATANITARSLTVSATGIDKVYDGTTNATVTLSDNRTAGDNLTTSYTNASFASKTAGAAKTVTVRGISLTGTDSTNYTFNSTTTTTANITARPLTVSATASNKVYDATLTAPVTLADNRLAGDSLTTSYTSASFADKNVGTAKSVTVSGISISGTDAPNYSANTSTSATANITVRSLTVSAAGVNKVYDGTTNATVTLSDNRVAGDSFTASYSSATFATKTVGTGKAVTVSGISLSGTDAPNYTANTTASTTVNITIRSLAVGAFGVNKVYDATTNATVTLTDNRATGDALTTAYTNASFSSKTVGAAKTVTVKGISMSGADASNYQLANTTTNTTANITARPLTVSATANNKAYDATVTATATLSDNRLAGDSLTTSFTSASFSDKNVGTAKTVTVSGITVSGTDAANYSANTTATAAANITARSLTVSATGVNKVYDGTTNASVTLSDNRLAGDSLTDSYASASFATKTVGTAKTITVSGISVSGADAPNYTANTTASAIANITALSLTVTATGVNKVYDGTTNATVTLSDNRVAGDSLTSAYTNASFATKAVGTSLPVNVRGISISGTDASNYQLASTTASTTANIAGRSLTVSATGVNKVYDATTAASVTLSDNRVVGDSLSTSYSSANFADKNVGTAKPVTVSGISISGTDAPNYSANTSASATANITVRSLTISATGVNKVYDGTTNAAVTLTDNRLAGDILTASYTVASFATKSVGTAKTINVSGISITGTDAPNYSASTTASTTANITTRALNVTATCVNKAYDGTTSATVTLSDNRLAGDSLTDAYSSANFADKNVGSAKPVSVSGISVGGTDAANYSPNATANATADITARSLNVTAAGVNKVYDGTISATVTLSDNRVAGDSLSTSYTTASFATKSVGTAKAITVSGISINGTDAPNYSANTNASATANITALSLTVTATGVNRVYDGTTNATVVLADNRLPGDSFTAAYTSAFFATKSAGTARPINVSGINLSGADAANYSPNTAASAFANITVRTLTITATGVNRVYDGTTTATVTLSDNRVAGDSLTSSYTSASFADKNVGTAKSIAVGGISISGTDAANYAAVSSSSATANITARSLTISATSVNKVYDGTTAATVNLADNRVSGDSLSTSYTNASFATKAVGTAKTITVSGITVSGTDAPNYTANTTASTSANITVLSLTVSATGVNKVYDATTTATVTLSDNRVAGDSFSTAYANASFANKNVGTAKSISVNGISISGTDAANYSANTSATASADITVRSLTITATGVNRVYDGTTNAIVTLSDNRVAGDSLTTSYLSAAFADKNVGTAKPVTVSGVAISGTDAPNYSANTSATATANITAKALTVSGITASDRIYDTTTSASLNIAGASLIGPISGDSVALNTASATGTFVDKNVGIAKTVTVSALSLSGTDAGNYSLTQPTTTASITKAGLTVTADNKSRAAGQANPTLTASYSGFAGLETLATSGVTGAPALVTTATNVAGTYPITATLGSLSATNYSFVFSNGVLTVTAAAANQLAMFVQPSATAIAGVPFATQPAIAVFDAYGNMRATDSSTVITAVRNAGNGTLQGTLTATAVNGVASFANLSHNVANTINLSFSSGSLTNVTSANIVVGPAAFSQLLLLAPGESAAPGTGSGRAGSPTAQTVGAAFSVTVNAADAFWNFVTNATDLVSLGSSDTTATLPLPTALAAGTANLPVYLNAPGTFTLTASDATDASKLSSTSSPITVSPAQFTPATGGEAISADLVTNSTFISLTGPAYSENASADVGTGTIVLQAPAGFVFDTSGPAPAVLITELVGTGKSAYNVNGVASGTSLAMTSVSATQLVFTVTISSSRGTTCSLTWQNIRVRPTAGAPLASGFLSLTGTAALTGVSPVSDFGTLREVSGAARSLAIQTQPSVTATAGVPFAKQPVLQVRDQFGNLRSSANGTADNSTVVSAARAAGSGTLQGTLNVTAANGLATFTNLSHTVATNITLAFSASGLTGTNSSTIAVSAAAADHLVFATQPGNAPAGVPLAPQPVLITRDPFGNNSVAGLGVSKPVTVSLSSGTGPLLGTTTLDIGTGAGNGTVAFTNLTLGSAATNNQLTAAAPGLTSATSGFFTVGKGNQTITFGSLSNQTYGNAPFAVSATASSGLPVSFTILSGPATIISNTVTIQGVGTVTIQASQAGNSSWNPAPNLSQSFAVSAKTITASITASNKIYDGGAAAAIASRALAGVVGGDIVNLIGGTASFADKNVGAGKTVIATGLSLGGASATNYLLASTSATTAADITPVTLRVQADDQTRAYGTTNPVLTVSYLGFVNSEGTNVLSGAPSVSTTATTNSLAGTYPITVSAGTLSAANYSFSFLSGQLTVTAPAVVLPGNLTGIQVTSGTVALSFVGSPGTTYHIQRTAGIQDAGTVWSDIGSATTDAAGQGTFTDNNPLSGQGFYRTSSQ